MRPGLAAIVSLFFALAPAPAADNVAPPLPGPDPRYKADLLLVIAHPDDDVVIGGYLARIALDEKKRIAVIYCTPGDGGGNAVGYEAGAALGQMRILEARRALGAWGIENIWFLGGHDTPGQNVLWSLDHWGHGRALEEVVRIVRLTRPEVILTWLPAAVVGENHDDHQASAVLATEAFDMAGDPTQFPAQVSPARDRLGMMNLTEGLLPWQPKKLYFFSDAFEVFGPYWHDTSQLPPFRKNIMDGRGPVYENTAISPSRHVSYAQLMAEQQVFYQTQEGDIGDRATKEHDFEDFEYPMKLMLGKSLVGGTAAGDVFEDLPPGPIGFRRVAGNRPERAQGWTFEIGDPWRFYSLFWKAHDLDRLAELMPLPEIATRFGDSLRIAARACNYTSEPGVLALRSALPVGWTDQTRFASYPVRPGECYPVHLQVSAPGKGKPGWQELRWNASVGSRPVGTVALNAYVGRDGGLPQ